MELSQLLSQPQLSVITRHADPELSRIQDLVEPKVLVEGRGDLEALLGRLLAQGTAPTPKTLDLIGHSTPDAALLRLGDWVIDAASATVRAFFRELAELEILPRLGVRALRLLGCQTADTREARATVCKLSEILGLEVLGSRQLLYSAHVDRRGFRRESEHLLASASELLAEVGDHGAPAAPAAVAYRRSFDVDALPAAPLPAHRPPWSLLSAAPEAAREVLRLVRRTSGAEMPGLLAHPSCELALPSPQPDRYYFVQILLGGGFVRVYPDGAHRSGVVFPIEDPPALRALVARMSRA